MTDTKQEMISFLSSCVEEVFEAVLIIRTINGVAVASSTNIQKAQDLMKEGSDWIGIREKSGFNRNVGDIK